MYTFTCPLFTASFLAQSSLVTVSHDVFRALEPHLPCGEVPSPRFIKLVESTAIVVYKRQLYGFRLIWRKNLTELNKECVESGSVEKAARPLVSRWWLSDTGANISTRTRRMAARLAEGIAAPR